MREIKGRAAQILAYVQTHGPSDVSTLAARTGIPRSTVARVCNELVDDLIFDRRETKPITYHPTGQAQAPAWVQAPIVSASVEPMCRAFYEAAKQESRMKHDTTAIDHHPSFAAAAQIWERESVG